MEFAAIGNKEATATAASALSKFLLGVFIFIYRGVDFCFWLFRFLAFWLFLMVFLIPDCLMVQ